MLPPVVARRRSMRPQCSLCRRDVVVVVFVVLAVPSAVLARALPRHGTVLAAPRVCAGFLLLPFSSSSQGHSIHILCMSLGHMVLLSNKNAIGGIYMLRPCYFRYRPR